MLLNKQAGKQPDKQADSRAGRQQTDLSRILPPVNTSMKRSSWLSWLCILFMKCMGIPTNSIGRPTRLPTAACRMARLMGMPFLSASTKGSSELLGS